MILISKKVKLLFSKAETYENSQSNEGKGQRRMQGTVTQLTKVGKNGKVTRDHNKYISSMDKIPIFCLYFYFHTFLSWLQL